MSRPRPVALRRALGAALGAALAVASAAGAALAPGSLRAQAQPASASPAAAVPDSVPGPLVLALVGGPFGGGDARPRLAVSRPPEGFAAELVPPAPAVAVGGITNRYVRTLVLAYPTPSAEAVASYLAFLERGGWARPAGPERAGFVDAPMTYAFRCRDSARVTVLPAPGAAAGSHVTVALSYSTRGDVQADGCGAPSAGRPFETLPFPALRAPAGARSRGAGGGSGGDDATISTRLATAMTPGDLLTHYGAQLDSAGWVVGAPLTGPGVGVRAVEARDARGRAWRGVLSAVEVGGERDVVLRMARVLPPPPE